MAWLEAESSKLSELSEARKLVAAAMEILQRDLQMSEEEASLTLQAHSRKSHKSMKQVAEAILVREEIERTHTDSKRPS
ncbi:MAG TPA: ANTAR domain-containing protein [Candidatus Acidoferrales bacterium]|nr:ANTAR domain-containing protein [Candidatus Acidoferrales bacterium]